MQSQCGGYHCPVLFSQCEGVTPERGLGFAHLNAMIENSNHIKWDLG